jgi:VWFA-related protein
MKKFLFLLCGAVALTSAIMAQQPASTPQKDDPVIKVTTNLIQIEVTVTDKNGKIVTDLTPNDFQLYENGEKQQITNFSLISASTGSLTANDVTRTAGTVPMSDPVRIKRENVRRTIALVVDDLTLSFTSVYSTKKALKKFVDEQMQLDDMVAIVRTGGGAGILQQFTSNKLILHAAIEKIRWSPLGGGFDSLASVGQNDTDISERFQREAALAAGGNSKSSTPIGPKDFQSARQKMESAESKNIAAQEKGIFAQTSLGTVKYIISGMAGMPGRKTLMLFSDGLTVGNESSKSRASSVFGYLQDVVDAANRSSVVVYTFDTKGLRSTSISASDSTYEIIDGHRAQKEQERVKEFKDSQDGLVYFAGETGGKALLNSDDLNGGIRRALNEQSSYYVLGYVPDADTFDADKRKFNKFEVKINRPGLTVNYKSGFFSGGPEDSSKPEIKAERQIAEALRSPFVQSDIALNINALYAHDPADGSYVQSFLHIDARDLHFTDAAEGWKTAAFDVVAVMAGDNGAAVESKESKYTIKARGPTYETMLRNGVVYVLVMPAAKPGLYQYRVALRDASSGKIGSASQIVNVPDLSKHKLTVSDLVVENVTAAAWQNILQGKAGNPSTTMFDTVLKQFPSGTILRYGFEVYNAKAEGSSLPQIETQAKIFQNDRALIQSNPVKFDASAHDNKKHVKINGAIALNDLQPGDYVLQIIATDTVSKQVSTRLFPFEITGKQE